MDFFDHLLLDVRYAVRVLRKSPGFTVVALITLMLGIGANVVVFGVLNAILLRPLHVSEPENLYQLRHKAWANGRLLFTSYPAFEEFRQRNHTFSGMIGVFGYSHATVRWREAVMNVGGDEVSGNYFDVLGVKPQIGRFFHEADEHGPGSAPYVVLSDGLWRSSFQGDRRVIGSTVEMNEHPFTVVGVAPAEFHGVERFVWPDYWIPMVNEEQLGGWDLQSRTAITVTVIGRLKPGVTARQGAEDLSGISVQLAREYPKTDDGQGVRLIHPGLWGDDGDVIRDFLYSVTLLGLLVLAAACANLASLFAARTADRSKELALRVALGSNGRRIVTQLLTEAVMVSLMGGVAGLVGADLLLGVLSQWTPAAEAHLAANADWRVYLAGLFFTLGSALLFGIVPAREAWRNANPMQAMKGFRRFALRDLLLGAQIAICTLMVTASLVAVRGLERAMDAPLGFQPKGAMLVSLDMGMEREQAILEGMRGIAGVTAVGTVNRTPMTGGLHGTPIFAPGTTEFTLNHAVLSPYVFQVSPGYFEAAGTRLIGGRDVGWHDTEKTPFVAVVNETFAHKMWGGGAAAIGQHFVVAGQLTEVVGVVENGKYHDLEEAPQAVAYLPFLQSAAGDTVFVVRSRRGPSEMEAALQRALSSLAPNVPLNVRSWTDDLSDTLLPARAATVALGVMGFLAAMLAVTGIFGMAAYSVSKRMKELGIRAALGASNIQVMSAAVGRPMVLLALGSLIGLAAGLFAGPLLGRIVSQANPRDPVVVGGAVLTMAVLGLVASAIPAKRALGVDPAKLMRED